MKFIILLLVWRGYPAFYAFLTAYQRVPLMKVNYLPWMPFWSLLFDVRMSDAWIWRPATLYTWSAVRGSATDVNYRNTPPSLPRPTLYLCVWCNFIHFFVPLVAGWFDGENKSCRAQVLYRGAQIQIHIISRSLHVCGVIFECYFIFSSWNFVWGTGLIGPSSLGPNYFLFMWWNNLKCYIFCARTCMSLVLMSSFVFNFVKYSWASVARFRRDKAPRCLDIGIRWGRMIKFTLRPLYPWNLLDRRLVWTWRYEEPIPDPAWCQSPVVQPVCMLIDLLM